MNIILFNSKKYSEVLYEWLNYKRSKIKESSYIKYLNQIETNIIPNLKDINFKNLKPNHIITLFNLDAIKKLYNSNKASILTIINSSNLIFLISLMIFHLIS